jgi:hypothetical protein
MSAPTNLVTEPPISGNPLLPAGSGPSLNGAGESVAAFIRDLPALLRTDAGRWVAYANGHRVRIAATQTELYRHCLKELGLGHDEFVVCCIVPDVGGVVEDPLR